MTRARILVAALGLLGVAALAVYVGRPGADPAAEPVQAPEAASDDRPILVAVDAAEPAGLRVEVLEVVRLSADVVEVRLVLTNRHPTGTVVIGDRFADSPGEAGTLSGAYLATEDGSARYFVLRDAEGAPGCSGGLDSLRPAERREAWIRFASPGPSARPVILNLKGLPPLAGLELPDAA